MAQHPAHFWRSVVSIGLFHLCFSAPAFGQSPAWEVATEQDLKVIPDSPKTEVAAFGRAVAFDGESTLIVGSDTPDDVGSAYVLRRVEDEELAWTQQQILTASDGVAGDEFGFSVDIEGNLAVVGAPNGGQDGAAYIFRFQSGQWVEQQKLAHSGGLAVAIVGTLIIVGDQTDDELGFVAGAARVYRYVPLVDAWTVDKKLLASDGSDLDRFGYSVDAIDGMIAVGAIRASFEGEKCGAVYIFELDKDGEWVETEKLGPAEGETLDSFGTSLDLNDKLLIAGAFLDDDQSTDAGAAYVFRRDVDLGEWVSETKLVASDGAMTDYFGFSAAVGNEVAVVGAYLDDDRGTDSGSAYVFRNDNGKWIETQKLVASEGEADDSLTFGLDLVRNLVVMGSPNDDDFGDGVGAIYFYDVTVPRFLRGDVNGDGVVLTLVDVVHLLNWAFLAGPGIPCEDAADVNGNNDLNPLSDAVFLLRWAFLEGLVPPLPGPFECGVDPDHDQQVGCDTPPEECEEG